MTKQEILTDLVSIQTLYRSYQRETDASMRSAIHTQFASELDCLIEDLRAECVAELGKDDSK